jgi:hypothetical protein
MTKLVYYFLAAVAVFVTAGGAYYYFTKVEVVTVQPTVVPPDPAASVPRPDHGDFQKRFEPKMPPADGGKPKQ